MLKSVWRTVLKWLPAALRLTVIFFVLFLTSIPVRAEETVVRDVQYIDYTDGSEKKICPEAIDITSVSGKTIGNGNWYVVTGRHTIDKRFKVQGECNIIFRDDSAIYDNKGISCNEGNTLNLYSESYTHEGVFECDCTEDNCAAIGGDSGKSGGTINIHKMRLYVESNWGGAAIGGGKGGNSGNISIYNARVIAKGGLNAAAIGGGNQGRVTSISIYGGDIEAEARGSYWYDNNEYKGHAAAIGSGCDQPQGGPIHIENGWVKATSVNGAGIGSAEENNAGEILISGGSVFAYSYYGAGIGGGRYGNGGETIITGGFVNAMSFYTGAGIGGGQKGSGGYVYIDGGLTIASGGNLYISLTDAYDYNNYGQGWGRDHPYFNIIYSIVEALIETGDYGGAGIGGGDHGSGGEVVIAGGEVIASSYDKDYGPWFDEQFQELLTYGYAIGGGRGKGNGSLDIYDHMHVMVGRNAKTVESVLGPKREEMAKNLNP